MGKYLRAFADRLEGNGEFVDGQAPPPRRGWVPYDSERRPPGTVRKPIHERLEVRPFLAAPAAGASGGGGGGRATCRSRGRPSGRSA